VNKIIARVDDIERPLDWIALDLSAASGAASLCVLLVPVMLSARSALSGSTRALPPAESDRATAHRPFLRRRVGWRCNPRNFAPFAAALLPFS
jgi:hypothetical protein